MKIWKERAKKSRKTLAAVTHTHTHTSGLNNGKVSAAGIMGDDNLCFRMCNMSERNVVWAKSVALRVLLIMLVVFVGLVVCGFGESFGAETKSEERTCTQGGICYKYKVENDKATHVTIDVEKSSVPTDGKEIKIPEKLGSCETCKSNGAKEGGYEVESLGDGTGSIVGELESSTGSSSNHNTNVGKFQMNSYSWFNGNSYPIFVIPSSVKKIENNAFHRLVVSSQNLNTLESIGNCAFQAAVIVNYSNNNFDMTNKQTLELNGVTSIGKKAFCARDDGNTYGTTTSGSANLKELIRFLWINGYTANIQGYKKIKFGDKLTKIDDDAFCGNLVLEEVTIPEKVTEIGKRAFKDCSNVKTVTFTGRCENQESRGTSASNDKLKIGEYAFKGTGISSVEINDKLELEEGVFSSCPKLETVTIKENVKSIKDRTFAGSAVTEISGSSLTEIGKEALAGTKITTDKFKEITKSVTKIDDGAFSSCDKLNGEVEIPSSVTQLGTRVFKDCDNITTAKIQGKSLKDVPASTYEDCDNLKTVELADEITEIKDSAFANCTALKMEELNKIVKNGKVTKIGNSSFENCTGLTGKLELSDNITEIGNNAFEGCTGITGDLEIKKVTKIGDDAFKNCTGIDGTIKIGEETTSEETKENGNGTIKIGKNAFRNCENAKKVEIKGQVSEIGEFAFYNTAEEQKEIDIESKVTKAGTRIFTEPDEIFIESEEKDLQGEFRWFGDGKPIIHYGDCTHAVQIECYIPGVKITEIKDGDEEKKQEQEKKELIDGKETNKIINVPCKSTFKFKVNKGEDYKGDIIVKLISEGQYSDSPLTEKTIYPKTEGEETSEEELTYEIQEVKRDQKIVVLTQENGTNLVLKAFASEVNGKTIGYNQRRSPVVSELKTTGIKGFSYNQTKMPLAVKKGDIVTYTIRVYNEGKQEGQADEITVRLPEGLKLVEDSEINKLYGWKLDGKDDEGNNQGDNEEGQTSNQNSEWQSLEEAKKAEQGKSEKNSEGQANSESSEEANEEEQQKEDKKETDGNGVKVYKTTYLKEHKIEKYSGKGKPEYQDVQIQCKVPNAKEDEDYLVLVAEISKGNDNNSVPNNADKTDFSKIGKKQGEEQEEEETEETTATNNYTVETEDDTDYETIQVNGSTKLEYQLVVKKIDGDSRTLLDGAKIRLYDKDKKVLEEVITKDGEADFGKFVTSGVVREREGEEKDLEGKNEIDSDIKDIYYIEEVETPMGYKRTIDGMIKIQVIVNKDSNQPVIICDFDGISEDVEAEGELEYTSITTKEQLKNIGKDNSGATAAEEGQSENSGKTGKSSKKINYRLDADIDLKDEQWTPINMEGTFDGNGHKISNVKLPSADTSNGTSGSSNGKVETIGFFGTYSGTIKNLTLEVKQDNKTSNQSEVQQKSQSAEAGSTPQKSGLAGLVGYMKEGTIDNCKVTFTIDQSNSKEKQQTNQANQENIGAIIGATDPSGLVNVKNSNGILKFTNGQSNSDAKINNVGAIIGYVGGNAIITECSNEGSSYSSSVNSGIGGFVGYSKDGGRVEFEKCTNKINILGKENVGGLIGCAIGSLAIDECSNEGQIGNTASTKSVGGLVGYAEPKGYQPKNINVDYQEGKVTVYLSNKETTDEYKINILKVCKKNGVTNLEKLKGAKFNVYKYIGNDADKNGESEKNDEATATAKTAENNKDGKNNKEEISSEYELIKNNAETDENGLITIDKIPMTSMTNDVYYIKEVEAPKGYDILVKDYIKVQLRAKWDGVNERYIIDPEITLSGKISDEEIKKLDSNKGDKQENITSSNVVKWNNLTIANSNNKGTIQGSQQVGGIVGLTKGLAVIENCHNKSNVEKDEEGAAEGNGQESTATEEKAKATNGTENKIFVPTGDGNVGGIIGDATPSSKDDLVEVIGCSNEVKIECMSKYNIGGIIGSAPVHVEIIGCENKGNIEGKSGDQANVGGILGASYSRAKIEDCKVTGDIIGAKHTAGGILGSATYATQDGGTYSTNSLYKDFELENTYLEINNCTVKDSKIGKNGTSGSSEPDNAGGIVGQSEALENIITDCTVENTTIESAFSKSGAVGRNSGNIYRGRIYSIRK